MFNTLYKKLPIGGILPILSVFIMVGCGGGNPNLEKPQGEVEKSREYTQSELQSVYEHIQKPSSKTKSISESKIGFQREMDVAFKDIKNFQHQLKERERKHFSSKNKNADGDRFGKNIVYPNTVKKVNLYINDKEEDGSLSKKTTTSVPSITEYY